MLMEHVSENIIFFILNNHKNICKLLTRDLWNIMSDRYIVLGQRTAFSLVSQCCEHHTVYTILVTAIVVGVQDEISEINI